ncbi:MAG: hypothetical protein H0V85_06235 [Thermoleophilaceae bacterium]|nr:hypothetical protein [Thermoleophilaceae bacterium]
MLERAYADPVRREVLQLVVDAYACQHPGVPERRSAQSVGIHLMTLCMVLEQGADPRDGPKLHKRMVARPDVFTWLMPPEDRGDRTVLDVLDTDAYAAAVTAWAEDVWAAWVAHHETVRAWIGSSLTQAGRTERVSHVGERARAVVKGDLLIVHVDPPISMLADRSQSAGSMTGRDVGLGIQRVGDEAGTSSRPPAGAARDSQAVRRR